MTETPIALNGWFDAQTQYPPFSDFGRPVTVYTGRCPDCHRLYRPGKWRARWHRLWHGHDPGLHFPGARLRLDMGEEPA